MPRITRKRYVKLPTTGDFCHRIQIERKTYSEPVNGIAEETWEVIYSPKAQISNDTGREYLKDNVDLYDKITKKFYVRTHPSIKIQPSDRILYEGEYYNIISVYDYDDNLIYTCIVAVRTE